MLILHLKNLQQAKSGFNAVTINDHKVRIY